MRFRITVSLHNDADNTMGFGRGIIALLRGVDEFGSLNRSAKNMGMAYSKAWRIVKETEAEFGVPLLDRDGAHGSTLTPECRSLMSLYDEMLSAADSAAKKVFDKYNK